MFKNNSERPAKLEAEIPVWDELDHDTQHAAKAIFSKYCMYQDAPNIWGGIGTPVYGLKDPDYLAEADYWFACLILNNYRQAPACHKDFKQNGIAMFYASDNWLDGDQPHFSI